MKRTLVNSWPVMLLLLLIASCGKELSGEEDLGQYYLKCKIDGVDKTFNFSATASQQDLGNGEVTYSVFGKAVADPNNMESLGFAIRLAVPFATGTYNENDPTVDYFLAGMYNPNTGDQATIFSSRNDENNPLQITFTEISSTALAGSFKGRFFMYNSDPNADSITITNGQFKVKIQK